MKKSYAIVILLLFLSKVSSGQDLDTKKLDALFDILSARQLAMGSLAISVRGEIQYQRAIGYSCLDSIQKTPASVETQYRIGSITKLFTAVMIFQLVEENKIQLTQKLNSFFPHLPNGDSITIQDMLYHRSGLHDYTLDTNFSDWMDKPRTQQEMLELINKCTPDFKPGTKAQYCNTNYLLLGYIIEKVCKVPYSEALERRITSKLSLTNTYYGSKRNGNKHESNSYKYINKIWNKQKETDLSIHGGAGSIVSAPTDMVRFLDALFAYTVVGKESLAKMKTLIDDYGMGLFSNKYGSKPSFGHNGRIEEFYSALWYFPNQNVSFAYCTNGINFPRTDIIEAILKICFSEEYEVPFRETISLQAEDIDQYLGQYFSTEIPIEVKCTRDGSKLLLETKGHVFEATPVTKNYFTNADFGYFFEFIPDKDKLLIKESDNIYYLNRRK